MTPFSSPLPPFWDHLGVVVGFLLSLAIFSFILRDTWLVRLAQYLLVGVSLGYAAVIAWQSVLWLRLFRPLLDAARPTFPPTMDALWLYWAPLGLGLILWLAGIDALRGSIAGRPSPLRRGLRLLAILPMGILAGVAVGVGIAGAIQGTLLPQFLRGADLGLPAGPPGFLIMGMLTLLITTGALIHLQVGKVAAVEWKLPNFLLSILNGWRWIGERALWLAAGFLFAQLFTSRITLLIARLEYFLFDLRASELWIWLSARVGGGP
ncbi:MAG: hypothetical protein KF893_09310 [Caldilineaceae bacterium]|nr:hypothetical protein [Caldilineaceae bacterium]